ncbi:MAG: 2-aminoethylphosphonate--pyruvate transaminase [Caldilineaceae bacterium]
MSDKLLFTPGPLTTSLTVKQAMLRDLGSRDHDFIALVRDIRRRLLALAEVSEETYTAVPMQGSGTFGLEAVLASTVPPTGKLLALVNGAYGRRLVQMAQVLHIPVVVLETSEDQTPDPAQVDALLAQDSTITHVSLAHCETTSGIINPVHEVGAIVQQHKRMYFVDAMSSFGAVPLNLAQIGIDYLVSSANKCIEGVPGFSFVIAHKTALLATEGYARSVSFDLLAQYRGLEQNGQFRFTPPTHALLAFHQALLELAAEGGVLGRAARYRQNHAVLLAGMQRLGFQPYLAPAQQGYIITAFRYPAHPNFAFDEFYQRLGARGFAIYPGKTGNADCFRIGHIGHLYPTDMENLVAAVAEVLAELEIVFGDSVIGCLSCYHHPINQSPNYQS